MKKFLFLILLICQTAWAKNDTQSGKLENAALQNGTSITVSGNRYNNGVYADLDVRNYWIDKVYGLVKLSLPAASQTSTGTATAVINVRYEIEEGGQFVSKTESGIQLTISADADKATDVAYFLAPDAQFIEVQVVSITKGNLSDVALTASIVTESFDYLSYSDVPAPITHNTALTAGGSLPVTWAAIDNAESYELEWTYISNQGETETTVSAFNEIEIVPFYFRNNSSRVEVTSNSYEIPLVYEKGYILYRVRAVGKSIVNSIPVWVKSNWTYLDNGTTTYPEANAYLYEGLENNINWQSSLSFAEEGKHKVVVSYHDGSSRNRQAVTRINTDERAVVGETFYDYNGRPIVQTLPVPVKVDSLGYYTNFNVVNGQSVQRKEDVVDANTCIPTGAQLSDKTGASNYYSPQNNFGTNGNTRGDIINKDLIPDAKKYPYSQTVYTPDNTGRIATQSGIGESNHLGSGHETQYLYATPLQTELCRLFGNQIGYAAHYKKNMVIDPNGQVSVSYLDLDGKVVATALAGGAPDNVQNLGNANTRSINEDLIKTNPMSNGISADSTSRIFNKKFVVTSNSIPYTFNYTGEFGFYDIPCNVAGTYTHIDGVVDVYVTLKDKCGAIIFSASPPVLQTPAGNTGARHSVSTGDVVKTLNTGEYTLTKVAVVNEDKLNAYTQEYLASSCAKKVADFEDAEYADVNLTDCNLTCEKCNIEKERLLALSDQLLTAEQKEDIRTMCANICDETIGCSGALNSMRADMSLPSGQYAEIRENRIQAPVINENTFAPSSAVVSAANNMTVDLSNTDASNAVHPESFPLSIFNSANKLPLGSHLAGLQADIATKEYWKYPIKIKIAGTNVSAKPKNYQILNDRTYPITNANIEYSIGDYFDRNGDVAYVFITKNIDLNNNNAVSYSPQITDASKLEEVDLNLLLYKIPVKYLAKIEDFEKAWQSHWAYDLLPYHPEFPYYIACLAQTKAHDFDYALMNLSFSDAKDKGFVVGGVPKIYEKEAAEQAQFKPVGIYDQWMTKGMTANAVYNGQPISMELLANRLVHCLTPLPTECGGVSPECNKTSIDTEEEWTTYRSLYFSLKQKFIKKIDMVKAVNNNYYNGCIGHSNYISSSESWYFNQPKVQTVTVPVYSCNHFLFWRGNRCAWINRTYDAQLPSYLISSQLCFIGNARYFKNKEQRFYPTVKDDASSKQQANCSSVVYDESGKPSVEFIPCESDILEMNQEQAVEMQQLKYESCGLCPLASDLESLLIKLTANNKIVTASSTISCSNDNIYLGEALRRSIIGTGSLTSVIYWSSTLSSDKKIISGSIKVNNLNVYNLTLTIPVEHALTFDELLSVCCLSVSGQTNPAFKVRATFKHLNVYQDIWLHGTINLDLKNCAIPPRCVLTEDASNTANFINMLAANNHLNSTAAVDLFEGINSTDPNDYLSNVNNYFDVVLSLLRISETQISELAMKSLNPTWTASTSNKIVRGTLSYTLNGDIYNLLIEVSAVSSTPVPTPLTLDPGKHIPDQFLIKNLKPVIYTSSCTSECGKEFSASLIVINNDQFSSQQVKIYTPTLQPVKCTTIVPATIDSPIIVQN
jgi:hypothetical protein